MNPGKFSLATMAITDLRALVRWLGLCSLVGACAGLAGVAFVTAVDFFNHALLERFVGIRLAHGLELDSATHFIPHLAPSWMVVFVPALGGLVCGWLSKWMGPEVRGGGTELVLQAYHHGRGDVAAKTTLGKWLASVITLGTGGSAGREGPMTIIGGGIGSIIGRWFGLGERERRLLLLAGAGAGVGAVFRVPLGAAIFAIEVLYRDGFEEEGVFPCMIASVCGYSTFVAVQGTGLMFSLPPLGELQLALTPLFALVGVAVVPFGYLFAACLRAVPRAMTRLRFPLWTQPALGGLLVGLVALAQPNILGIGYGWVQQVIAPADQSQATLGVASGFLVFALAKLLATSLTVGSGGAGGTFAPSIVIGGFVGGAVGQALRAMFPGWHIEPAAFALVGMGSFLGGIAHVPFSAVIIVCELAGNYSLLVPLMIGVGLSFVMLHRTTLYPAQVSSPAASPARAGTLALESLRTLQVRDLQPLRAAPTTVDVTMPINQLIALFVEHRATIFPVRDENGDVNQMVLLRTMRTILNSSSFWSHLIVADAATPLVSIGLNNSLQELLVLLVKHDCEELLVRDAMQNFVGVVGHDDIARLTLRQALQRTRLGD